MRRRRRGRRAPGVNRLLQRAGKTGQVRTDPKFENVRGPNVRELRCVQRRLSPVEAEALITDYEAGGRAWNFAGICRMW